MPNQYKRKNVEVRGKWTEEQLKNAFIAVQNGMSVRGAATAYQIPRKTLERRIKTKNSKKGAMGPCCMLGKDNEDRLVRHIKEMQKRGFPLTIDDVRRMAFQFAEQLGIKHRFNVNTEKAGYDWLNLFLSRNPDISLRKSEGVSLARAQGMNRGEVDNYFKILGEIIEEHGLFDKPGNIFNMDETGLQLNNRPSHVLAAKGSKAVSTVTSTEKGETITVIACCNAEGGFIPPACIMKGKYKKEEFQDGMPPGSILFMSQKSAYINSQIFLEWLRDHFLPRKPEGKVLMVLDGHSTHCSSVEMLQFAKDHEIILVAMPSHTSHYLQPLDRAVFKSLKCHFYESCRMWLKRNPGRRITRLQFGELLNEAWGKSATPQNGISAFKATGIFPFNPSAIPDYAFSMVSGAEQPAQPVNGNDNQQKIPASKTPSPTPSGVLVGSLQDMPGTSHALTDDGISYDLCVAGTSKDFPRKKETPSKILQDLSFVAMKTTPARKRAKQVATLLTSPEHITKRQMKETEKLQKEERKRKSEEQKVFPKVTEKKTKNSKSKKELESTSSSEDEFIPSGDSDLDVSDDLDSTYNCKGCGENYYQTKKKEDWIRCVTCLNWLHENCTELPDKCHECGNHQKTENVMWKGKGKAKKKN